MAMGGGGGVVEIPVMICILCGESQGYIYLILVMVD